MIVPLSSRLPARARLLTLVAPTLFALVGSASGTERHTVTSPDESWECRVEPGHQLRSFTIRNVGDDVVESPRIVVNGRRNWFSTPTILAEILRPEMTEREKAIAVWDFLARNRYHDQPAHTDIEVHDPVRFLNVWGYGFCDDSATNFMVLCREAGLRARVWGLSGHVVPEAYFDGGWHMLDPDGEIYYLEDDGDTIASVETLARRPDLIFRHPSPLYRDPIKLVEIYSSTDNNRISTWYDRTSEARHTMAFSLRPGEELLRSRENRGKYFATRFPDAPRRFGNGRFTFEPVIAGGIFARGAESVRDLEARRDGDSWRLAPTRDDSAGVLVYSFESPYPFVDAQAEIGARLDGEGAASLEFSESDDGWTPLWSSTGGGLVSTTVPIGSSLRTRAGRPVWSYSLRLTLRAPAGSSAAVDRLRFTSDIQLAPHSLPDLRSGENTIRYMDDTTGRRTVEVIIDLAD